MSKHTIIRDIAVRINSDYFVDCDSKPHVIGTFKTYEEARAAVDNDIRKTLKMYSNCYGWMYESNAISDMSVVSKDGRIGVQWSILQTEIVIDEDEI